MIEKLSGNNLENKSEKYEGYVILGIGEGGGYSSGYKDKPIGRFKSVADKIKQGATYLSIDKLDEKRIDKLDEKRNRVGNGLITFLKKLLKIRNDNSSTFKQYVSLGKDFKKNFLKLERNFIQGDMVNLPLGNNSVNEIYLENVLSLVKKGKDVILRELLRVLKNGGKLYIIEYYTPYQIKKYLEDFNDVEFPSAVDIKIFSGKEMINKMEELGLSKKQLETVIWYVSAAIGYNMTTVDNVFLAEIIKQ